MKIHELLKELESCDEAQEWASDKTWEQIYNDCHRGDWLCWLFVRTNPEDLQLLTLVKGHQANTVRHLMKDKRSLAAVDAAIAYGEGRISLKELNAAAHAAYYAAADAAADAADYAAYAAAHAAYYVAAAAADYASAASVDANADAAYAADADAKKQNQQQTTDIFRKFIPIEKFNI